MEVAIPDRQRAQVTTPEAVRLAGIWAVAVDLDFVLKFCERLETLSADRNKQAVPGDPLTFQALWVAALVAYARCFEQGPHRVALSEADVNAELRAWHGTFIGLRDRHIAHPLDPHSEGYRVDVTLTLPQSGVRAVTGVVVSGEKVAGPSSQQVRELTRLARSLRALVGDRFALLQNAVVAQARARPIEEMYATRPSEIVLKDAPGPDRRPSTRRRKPKPSDRR